MHGVQRQWQQRNALTLLLLPLSVLFGALTWVRRRLYRAGLLSMTRLPVPVIIVGNLSVGGTGKTPLVAWLCEWLRSHGWHPGIISRGYGGDGTLREVTPESLARQVGDEPVLLARRCRVPVVVSPRRALAGLTLLRAHPECDIVVSDDGLQHYALARDLEIALLDGARGLGNGLLLPAGPLREAPRRLTSVDAVVVHGNGAQPFLPGAITMRLRGALCLQVCNPAQSRPASHWRGRSVHALAGIGDPERFFRHLESMGLTPRRHAFPDHHPFAPADLDFAGHDDVLMTEKDAVKCAAFARPNWWYLPVEADVDPALGELLQARLRKRHGP